MNRENVIIHKHQWTSTNIGELIDMYDVEFVAENIDDLYKFESKCYVQDIKRELNKLVRFDVATKHVITIQKYARRFLIVNHMSIARTLIERNVEFEVDSITCERLEEPVLIASDWIEGSRVIYNDSTLKKCACIDETELYYYIDETGIEQMDTKTKYVCTKDGFRIYKSPFTRNYFTSLDIHYISHTRWFIFANLILKQMNLKNIES
jgi:hypothetical protein